MMKGFWWNEQISEATVRPVAMFGQYVWLLQFDMDKELDARAVDVVKAGGDVCLRTKERDVKMCQSWSNTFK